MTVPVIKRFAPMDNVDFINSIRNSNSRDYQQRIPEATQARLQETLDNIWDYRATRNEFVDTMVNKIGTTIARANSWSNPLAKFKQGMLRNGDTIEEVQVGLVQGNVYEHDRDYLERALFGQETPEVQTRYHKINREQYYKITIKDFALKRAFLSDDGLSQFIVNLMEAPTTSDNWDEFLLTAQLFAEYDRTGGFFNVNIPDISNIDADAPDARVALRQFRAMADNLQFISRHYNAAKMPVSATADELHLFVTPEANATMDVEALAAAFNVGSAAFNTRKTVIPKQYMAIPGVEAILTTENFFVMADTLLETSSVINPLGLYNNYFLHHHSVISASPFVPAIAFGTRPGDVINIADTPVTDVAPLKTFNRDGDEVTTLKRGDTYYVTGAAVTTPEGGLNDAVRFEQAGLTSSRSRIDQTGYLHVSLDEPGKTVTLTATAVDDNDFTETLTRPIVGDRLVMNGNDWSIEADTDNDGTPDDEEV